MFNGVFVPENSILRKPRHLVDSVVTHAPPPEHIDTPAACCHQYGKVGGASDHSLCQHNNNNEVCKE